MGKRAPKKIKKLKGSQKIVIPKVKQELHASPPPDQKILWPPKLPPPKRPIGAGNPFHGKPRYDPVYPTLTSPSVLLPRYPISWRNGGRAMLCMAMAALEGLRRIWQQSQSVEWQAGGYCSPRCGYLCAKSHWRIFCAWRIPDSGFQEHLVRTDELLNSYKGPPLKSYQSFVPPPGQARRNLLSCVAAKWDRVNFRYQLVDPSRSMNATELHVPISRHESDHTFIRKE